MISSINIVCLDVPFPANYGGAINMFHKIRWLHKKGIKIYLHCYTYGQRKPSFELEKYCEEIYYYQRKTGIWSLLSVTPYNVVSRSSKQLRVNLLKNNYPIILEALHSCYWLNDKAFVQRAKIFRESNIEHDYFFHLAKNERNIFKRLYLCIEALKMKAYEKKLAAADLMLVVSKDDEVHFKKAFPLNTIRFLPSFHQNDAVTITPGLSDYVLYHGNLSVSENNFAADWLIDHVFSRLQTKVIIAGLNPPSFLVKKISSYPHITLMSNCNDDQMNSLIANAQVHCLYTPQPTGLKLKLLNVLFKGRHVVSNEHMVAGTELKEAVEIANAPADFIRLIKNLMNVPFDQERIAWRTARLDRYQNQRNITDLITAVEEVKK